MRRVTYRFSYAMRHDYVNKVTPPTPTPCHMRHSQNFDKIDSFLKPVLNIFIPCNLMQAGGGDCKRGGWYFVSNLQIHQNKNWHYLGPFRISKVELFAEIAFGERLMKAPTQIFHWFHNPAGIYLLIVNNANIRARCKICSKLTIKTPERRQWCSGVFIFNFEHISQLAVMFLLLTLDM